MAGKVNTKFVVMISAILLAVFGVTAGAAYFLLSNNAADNAMAGDKLMAAGKPVEAAERFSKAVNKEQTNVEYLQKWRDALGASTFDNDTKYRKRYEEMYSSVRQLAIIQPENTQAHFAYLRMFDERTRGSPPDAGFFNQYDNETSTIIKLYGDKAPGPWESIKRFRGMSNAEYYFAVAATKREVLDGALLDLQAAVRADPTDGEAAVSLANTYMRMAERAMGDRKDAEAAEFEKQGLDVLDRATATNPNNPYLILSGIARELSVARQELQKKGKGADPEQASKDFVAKAGPMLEKAFEACKAMKQPVDERLLNQFRTTEVLVFGQQQPKTEELLRTGLAADKSSAQLSFTLAEILAARNDYKAATAELEKIVAMPIPALSTQGLKLFGAKNAALAQQVLWNVRVWEAAAPGPERDAALERSKALRTALAESESADSIRLQLVDAFLAVTVPGQEGLLRANQLLEKYNASTKSGNPEAVFLAAQVAKRLNQPGKARDMFQKQLELQPTNVAVMMELADIEMRSQGYENAARMYATVLRLAPGNEQARTNLDMANALAGKSSASDPIVGALIEADRLSKEIEEDTNLNDAQRAQGRTRVLDYLKKKFVETKSEKRVALALANAYMRINDKAGAAATLAKAIEADPNDPMLKREQMRLTAATPMDAALQEIDASNAVPVEKALSRAAVYRMYGFFDKMRDEIANAQKIDPNDKRVIEVLFINAVDSGKLDQAGELVERAVKENLDGMNGDSFRARLLAAKGDHRQAVTVLKGVIDRGGAQPEVYRLSARSLTLLGKPGEAIDQYRQSLKLRPNEISTVIELIAAQQSAGKPDEALTTARENRRFGEADQRFLDVWLAAESAAGDPKVAVSMRERIRSADPANRTNNFTLAGLYMDANEMDKARAVIDQVRKAQDGSDAAFLDASWHWRKGDAAKARGVIDAHLAALPAKDKTLDLYLGMARFYLDRNDIDSATAALSVATPLQDPKLMQADRSLSDAMIRLGKLSESIEAARRVVAAGADTPESLYQKRVVECLVLTGKLDDAQKESEKIAQGNDVTSLLILAALKEAQKDDKAQRDILNQAVSRFPTEHAVFIRRGQFLMRDTKNTRDAIADFTKAIELSPDNVLAYRLRSQAYAIAGDPTLSMNDLRAALRAAPGDNALISSVLNELMRTGKEQDARDVAAEVAERRKRDTNLLMGLGQFFLSAGRYDISRRYFGMAFETDKSDSVAMLYLTALLEGPDPDKIELEKTLGVLGDRVKNNPGMLMSRARLRAAQKKQTEAASLAVDALRKCDQNTSANMSAWFVDLRKLMPERSSQLSFLEGLQKQGLAPEWMTFFRGATLIEDDKRRDEGFGYIQQVAGSTKIIPLKLASLRYLGSSYYTVGKYTEAAKAWTDGLAESPNDTEMTNNLAFVLTKRLGRVSEAVPLAERLATLTPDAPDALDTIGLVFLKSGRIKEAIPKLEKAFARATNANAALSSGVHLAEAFRTDGNIGRMTEVLARLDAMVLANPALLNEDDGKVLQELRGSVGK